MFSLVFSRRYSMAHRFIAGNSEKCAVPHGHNEIVTVQLKAVDPSPLDGVNNMVEPFERAKTRWHRWVDDYVDHALQLSEADPCLSGSCGTNRIVFRVFSSRLVIPRQKRWPAA